MGTGEPRCPRQRGWKAVVVSSAETEAETACLTAGQAAYRLQAPPPTPLSRSPSHVRLQPQEFALYLRQQESGSALQAY